MLINSLVLKNALDKKIASDCGMYHKINGIEYPSHHLIVQFQQ